MNDNEKKAPNAAQEIRDNELEQVVGGTMAVAPKPQPKPNVDPGTNLLNSLSPSQSAQLQGKPPA